MVRVFLILCLLFQVSLGCSVTVQKYRVSGSVVNPGELKWEKGLTLGEAIEAAGGMTQKANRKSVTLIRNKKSYMYSFEIESHRGIPIYSKDVVEVKEVLTPPLIRANQVLRIAVSGPPLTVKGKIDAEYAVSSDGMLKVWKLEPIKAHGKTKAALAKELAEAYRKAGIITAGVFQVISYTVTYDDNGQFFTIGGEVEKPGQKEWKNGMTLQGTIDAAGGAKVLAVLERIKLYRNGKIYKYDLTKEKNQAILVYPRDVVEVPAWSVSLELRMQKENEEALKNSKRKEGEVADEKNLVVSGAVNKPGEIPWIKGLTLKKALEEAGGFSFLAQINKISVTRKGKITVYNFKKEQKWDMEIFPDDIINVAERLGF